MLAPLNEVKISHPSVFLAKNGRMVRSYLLLLPVGAGGLLLPLKSMEKLGSVWVGALAPGRHGRCPPSGLTVPSDKYLKH